MSARFSLKKEMGDEWQRASTDLRTYLCSKPKEEWGQTLLGEVPEPLLSIAARENDEVSMRMLINAGVNVNHQSPVSNLAPIHVACLNGSDKAVELLCCAGADLGAFALSNRRPIDCALENGTWRTLVANGVRLRRRNFALHRTLSREMCDFEKDVLECRRSVISMLLMKRKMGPRGQYVDKFLFRQIALALWAERANR